MKTIEERGTHADIADNYIPNFKKIEVHQVYDACDAVAEYQKAIDIEKACDVYRNELQELLDIFTRYGEMRGIEQLGDIISIDGSVLEFRKAMEGGEV